MKDHHSVDQNMDQNVAPDVGQDAVRAVEMSGASGNTATRASTSTPASKRDFPSGPVPSVEALQALVEKLDAEVASLGRAMATREVTGQATGLLAAWLTIGTDEAWQVLRVVSNLTNLPAREVARLLIASANGRLTGTDDEMLRRIADALPSARERAAQPRTRTQPSPLSSAGRQPDRF